MKTVFSAFPTLVACCLQLSGISQNTIAPYSTIFELPGVESAYPRLSNDDRKVLYQSNQNKNWEIRLYDRQKKTHQSLVADGYNNNFPDWSPDNQSIAFVSDKTGDEDIYLMDLKTRKIRNITNDPGRDIHPYFSPDGAYILFNSTRGNGSLDIYRYDLGSGKPLRLTDTHDDETCARYSPDMKQLVFLRNSQWSDDVFVMDAATFVSTNLTNTPEMRDGWPMYSFDGRWIYYSSMESGAFQIYRISPEGKNKKQITVARDEEEDARAYVAHDNKYLLFNKRKGPTISILLQVI